MAQLNHGSEINKHIITNSQAPPRKPIIYEHIKQLKYHNTNNSKLELNQDQIPTHSTPITQLIQFSPNSKTKTLIPKIQVQIHAPKPKREKNHTQRRERPLRRTQRSGFHRRRRIRRTASSAVAFSGGLG